MDPQVFLAAVVIILVAAIGIWGAVKIAKIMARATSPGTLTPLTISRRWIRRWGHSAGR